jgi:DNA-binding LacI/PurR family transcriptional regulator
VPVVNASCCAGPFSVVPDRRFPIIPGQFMSNIKSVAKLAGCSIATVSRCFNAPHLVRDTTLARVMTIARQQKFRPSIIGQQLRKNQTGLVGVMLPSVANPVFADCIGGIEQVLNQSDKRMLLTTTQYDSSKEEPLVEMLLRQKVDGLLLTVADTKRCRTLVSLSKGNVPYMLMYNHARGYETVSVDDRKAACDAVQHLLNLGHRRIAMLAGFLTASDRSALRHLGYQDAMHSAGLKPLPLAEVDFGAQALETQVQCWFDEGAIRPTAVFCSTDLLALGVIKALRERSIRIPQDISVIGFDGLEYGRLIEPTLATISQPNKEIGRHAAERLLRKINGDTTKYQPLFLAHTLLAGRSAGPASAPRIALHTGFAHP